MQQPIQSTPYATSSLEQQLSVLAAVDAAPVPVLSCYLDARQGAVACRDFLADRYLQLAGSLPASQRELFDEAVTMVDAAFGQNWSRSVSTIAVFARPGAEGRFLQVLPLVDVIPNRVEWYGLPQLLPLIEAAASTTHFRLLLDRGHDLYVVDVDGRTVETRAWASLPRIGDRRLPDVGSGAQSMGLRRALLERVSLPLVVAAAAPKIDELARWLPSRSKAHLVERVVVPEYLDFNQAVRFVIDDFEDRRRLESRLEVMRLIRASRGQGLAVLGPLACMEALRAGGVETLVLARGATFPRVWHCQRCGDDHANSDAFAQCAKCGGMDMSCFDFAIEIAVLAKRNGINVVFSDADELRYLGGVGCLLMQPADTGVMRIPAPRRHLDLVA